MNSVEIQSMAGRDDNTTYGHIRTHSLDYLPANAERTRLQILFGVGALVLLAQGTAAACGARSGTLSNIFILIPFILAVLACMQRAYRGPVQTRTLWILIASGFLLSITGQVISTYEALLHPTTSIAGVQDFFFVIYGIPLLLAISFANDYADLEILFWLDALQAVLAAVLTYLQIFSTLPSLGHPTPISAIDLMNLYNVENFVLAVAVTLRLYADPEPAKKHLYRILSIYLWVYAVAALIVGYFELERNMPTGLQDVAWGIPCLSLLTALAFWRPSAKDEDNGPDKNRSMSLLINNLSPILFTLLIVIMAARIAPQHRWIGLVSITLGVTLYGLRAALLQGKYIHSQEELAKSAGALVDVNARLIEMSIRDGLTGAFNRRHFDEVFQQEWKRAARTKLPISLLMLDVDSFKAMNDRYGHPAGDECLRKVSQGLLSCIKRSTDVLARYGGEEFVVILPGANPEGALLIAERMRAAVMELEIPNEHATADKVVTVSIGISSVLFAAKTSTEEMLREADTALYCAKMAGKNCCELRNDTPAYSH